MDYSQERETARQAATRAAETLDSFQHDNLTIDHKHNGTEQVTDADIAAQETIIDHISNQYPSDGFHGEEQGISPDGQDRIWTIDPIDGTANYIHGNPFYCVSVALRVNETPTVGVVYAPALDMCFEAVQDSGAWLNQEQIAPGTVETLADALVQYTPAGLHDGKTLPPDGQLLLALLSTGCSFRKFGATALEICMAASGMADAYIATATTPWDAEAGRIIAEEAGLDVRWKESIVEGRNEIIAAADSISTELATIVDTATGREG